MKRHLTKPQALPKAPGGTSLAVIRKTDVLRSKGVLAAEKASPHYDILQLPDVARPGVIAELFYGIFRKRLVMLPREGMSQGRNIAAVASERRHKQRKAVYPIEQILSERIIPHALLQIPVRGKYQLFIKGMLFRTAQTLVSAVFYHA